jgi:chromosome segregation ATPase
MQNQQMKNKVDFLEKETEKLKSKNSSDLTILAQLREEKQKLEQQLKKVSLESKETSASASTLSSQQGSQIDKVTRRLQLQNQVLETQVKDSLLKITNLENKLADVLRSQKPSGPPEESNKVKMNQLEGSMKKITQDLFEVKGYLNESKKEANKLRQEKTALENQMEKLKKESNKGKSGSKKLGGKVA